MKPVERWPRATWALRLVVVLTEQHRKTRLPASPIWGMPHKLVVHTASRLFCPPLQNCRGPQFVRAPPPQRGGDGFCFKNGRFLPFGGCLHASAEVSRWGKESGSSPCGGPAMNELL